MVLTPTSYSVSTRTAGGGVPQTRRALNGEWNSPRARSSTEHDRCMVREGTSRDLRLLHRPARRYDLAAGTRSVMRRRAARRALQDVFVPASRAPMYVRNGARMAGLEVHQSALRVPNSALGGNASALPWWQRARARRRRSNGESRSTNYTGARCATSRPCAAREIEEQGDVRGAPHAERLVKRDDHRERGTLEVERGALQRRTARSPRACARSVDSMHEMAGANGSTTASTPA